MSFSTLTLYYLCLLPGVPLPIPPLNRIFQFSDSYHLMKFNCLPPLISFSPKCHKMQLGLKSLLLDSTLCSNSLELLVFSSRTMLWRKVTMVLRPFTRCNI